MMNKINGIIFKTQPYQESSKLLQVFTKKGKLTINAKGSQKLNSEYRIITQYLNEIEFEYNSSKTFITLSNAKLINDFSKIKKDFDLAKTASLALEIIDKVLVDDNYNEKIYDLLIDTLNSKNLKIAVLSFSLKMLYFLGYGMNLISEKKGVIGVSVEKGGLVYAGERYHINLNIEESITLLKLTHMKINEEIDIDMSHLSNIERFIYNYYESKLDLKLNALKG